MNKHLLPNFMEGAFSINNFSFFERREGNPRRELRQSQHPHQENPENLLKKANKARQRIQRRTTERKGKTQDHIKDDPNKTARIKPQVGRKKTKN